MRRNTAILWLLIVFLSGTVVGVASHRYFTRETIAKEERRSPSREQVRQEYLGKLRDRIGVSEEQIAKIVTILDEGRAASDARRKAMDTDMNAIQDQTREKMRAIFTPEQLVKYEAWREERKREREKWERERGRDGSRGGR
jgi:hypothetical protein